MEAATQTSYSALKAVRNRAQRLSTTARADAARTAAEARAHTQRAEDALCVLRDGVAAHPDRDRHYYVHLLKTAEDKVHKAAAAAALSEANVRWIDDDTSEYYLSRVSMDKHMRAEALRLAEHTARLRGGLAQAPMHDLEYRPLGFDVSRPAAAAAAAAAAPEQERSPPSSPPPLVDASERAWMSSESRACDAAAAATPVDHTAHGKQSTRSGGGPTGAQLHDLGYRPLSFYVSRPAATEPELAAAAVAAAAAADATVPADITDEEDAAVLEAMRVGAEIDTDTFVCCTKYIERLTGMDLCKFTDLSLETQRVALATALETQMHEARCCAPWYRDGIEALAALPDELVTTLGVLAPGIWSAPSAPPPPPEPPRPPRTPVSSYVEPTPLARLRRALLCVAAAHDNWVCVSQLVHEAGLCFTTDDDEALCVACRHGSLGVLIELHVWMCQHDSAAAASRRVFPGMRKLLQLACAAAHSQVVYYLATQCGATAADVHSPDALGLVYACRSGSAEAVTTLLRTFGFSAAALREASHPGARSNLLEDACQGGNLDAVRALWRTGFTAADVLENRCGALAQALHGKHFDVAHFLCTEAALTREQVLDEMAYMRGRDWVKVNVPERAAGAAAAAADDGADVSETAADDAV